MWQLFLRPLLRQIVRVLRHQSDLVLLGVGLFLLQGFIRQDNFLAQADWRPWIILNISAAAWLRGRSLGLGPHPDLRRPRPGGTLQSLTGALAPWWVWFAVVAAAGSEAALRSLMTVSVVGVVLIMRRRRRTRSAWRPQASGALVVSALGVALLGGLIAWAAHAELPGSLAALAAAAVVAVSLSLGDPSNLAQRWAAWEGNPVLGAPRHELVTLSSLVFLPAAGLELVPWLMSRPELNPQAGQLPADGFVWAGLATLYVLVWSSFMWRARRPSGLACLLREVVPAGGRERRSETAAALDFSEAPRGALAVEPLNVRRKPRFHPWYVPVDSGRAASAELTSRPLWPRTEPASGHALGDARCAEDGIPGVMPLAQWDEVTIEPHSRESRESLAESRAGVRRQVILRPYHRPLHPPLAVLPPTFVWESRGAHRLYQLNTGRPLRLAAGDVLVLSSAGIVRCFEFEPGAEVDLHGVRHVPQPEDYLEAGS